MKKLAALLLLTFALSLTACAPKAPNEPPAPTVPPDASISAPAAQTGTPAADESLSALGVTRENYPKLDGSTSTLNLVQVLYEKVFGVNRYGADGADVPQTASKTVPSYQKLIAGEVDLILVPYASPDVRQQAQDAGVELEYTQVAAEALIFVTPADNPAQNITGDQVRDIYLRNAIPDWTALGGDDHALVPICRNADSGSQSQMDNLILDGQPMEPSIQKNHVELTMEGMLEQVAFYHTGGFDGKPTNSYALGYTLFTYLQNMDEVTGIGERLKILDYEGVPATAENIADGSYPLSDGYYAVTRADLSADHPARAVVKWLSSLDGQLAVLRERFLPVSTEGLPDLGSDEAALETARYYFEQITDTGASLDRLEITARDEEKRELTVTAHYSKDGETYTHAALLRLYQYGWSFVGSLD